MTQVHWNALMGDWPNPGAAFVQSFQGAQDRRRRELAEEEDRAWQREQRSQQRGAWQRESDVREGMAGVLLGQPTNALLADPSDGLTLPPPARSPGGSTNRQAYERLVRADPEKALTFHGQQLDITAKQLKASRDLHNMAMQLLGGVHDQATYDLAKQRAAQLYRSFGHDASEFITGLPPEYSPDVVHGLQLQGMDTSRQLQAIARENRLDWDIEDDQLDNKRADDEAASRATYRRERLSDYDRAETGRDRRNRRSTTTSRENNIRSTQQSDTNNQRSNETRIQTARRSRGAPVRVKSLEEARQLAPGTVFITPDGRTKVR